MAVTHFGCNLQDCLWQDEDGLLESQACSGRAPETIVSPLKGVYPNAWRTVLPEDTEFLDLNKNA